MSDIMNFEIDSSTGRAIPPPSDAPAITPTHNHRGRPRIYVSNAHKQAEYRKRKIERGEKHESS